MPEPRATEAAHPCDVCSICGGCGCGWSNHCCAEYAATAPHVRERLIAYGHAIARGATAVIGPSRTIHSPDCGAVKAHLRYVEQFLAQAPCPCQHGGDDLAWTLRGPSVWPTTTAPAVTGRSCKRCSPSATIQAPPRPRRVRLTGLGWPEDDGTCTRGRLPAWSKGHAR